MRALRPPDRRRTSRRSPTRGVGVAHCPTLEHAARRRHRARARRCSTPAFASGSASTARPRTSAATCSSRSSRRCSSRAARGGPGGDDRPRRAAPRHARRRGGARPRRHRLARAGQARGPRRVAHGRAGNRRRRDPVAGLVLAGPHRVDRLYVGGEEVVRDGHARRTPTRRRSRGTIALQARRFAPCVRSRRTSSTPRAASLQPASASSSTAATSSSRRGETDDDGRIRELADVEPGRVPARLPSAVAVLPPRRARARAGRRRLPRPAARLVRTGARPTAAAERRGARRAVQRAHRVRRTARGARGPARPCRRGRARADATSEKLEALETHPRNRRSALAAEQRGDRARRCSPSSPC